MSNYSHLVVAATLVVAQVAHADEADDSKSKQVVEISAQRDKLHLDELNSAGSRLALTPRETPAIVESITQDDMQLRGLRTAREAFADIPGTISGNVPSLPAAIMMRGFSGAAIAVLQDDVHIATSTFVQRNTNTWHFERIDVIKGPASVLFGEGALGGAINKVTRKPTLDGNHFDALLSYGSFNTSMVAAGANFKFSDQAAMRIDASRLGSDSLYDVDDNKTTSRGLTASYLLKPSGTLSMLWAVDHYEDRYDASYEGLPLVAASVARDPSGVLQSASGLVIDKALRRVSYSPEGAYSGNDETTLRSRIESQLDAGWSWRTDLTAFRAHRAFLTSDNPPYAAPSAGFPNGSILRSLGRYYHEHRFWNARTALADDGEWGNLRNRLAVGAEYNHTDFDSLRQAAPYVALPVDPYNPIVGTFPTSDSAWTNFNLDYDSRLDIASVFGEDAVNVTPEWLLVAGARYDAIDLWRGITDYNATPHTQQTANPHFHPFTWRAGSTYDLGPETTVYAQYTTAVVPVTSFLLQGISDTKFKLTTGRSVEAGFKATALDRRVTITGAVYYIRQNDIVTRDPANPQLTVQGGSQSSRGIEINAEAAATPALSLGANLGYTHAKYDQLIEAGGAVRNGNQPINTPSTTAGLRAIYAVPETRVTVSGFLHYVSGFYTDTANSIHVNAHATLDASVAWRIASGTTLALRGRNLTDAFYVEYSGVPVTNVFVGAPRSFEVSLAMHI